MRDVAREAAGVSVETVYGTAGSKAQPADARSSTSGSSATTTRSLWRSAPMFRALGEGDRTTRLLKRRPGWSRPQYARVAALHRTLGHAARVTRSSPRRRAELQQARQLTSFADGLELILGHSPDTRAGARPPGDREPRGLPPAGRVDRLERGAVPGVAGHRPSAGCSTTSPRRQHDQPHRSARRPRRHPDDGHRPLRAAPRPRPRSAWFSGPRRQPSRRRRTALAEHLLWMMGFLHAHHSGEDEGLYPLVVRRNPGPPSWSSGWTQTTSRSPRRWTP